MPFWCIFYSTLGTKNTQQDKLTGYNQSKKLRILAERKGFEPLELLHSTVFKTAAIDHSAISPSAKVQ